MVLLGAEHGGLIDQMIDALCSSADQEGQEALDGAGDAIGGACRSSRLTAEVRVKKYGDQVGRWC
jgi:hypothetical protein